jgi:hypothetical protein
MKIETIEKSGPAPTQEVNKPNVSLSRDVLPCFLPVYVFFISHFVYQTTGNMLLPIWIASMLNCPAWKCDLRRRAETNLDRVSEQIFAKDWRFLVPLYVYTIMDLLTWIWALLVFSDSSSMAQEGIN